MRGDGMEDTEQVIDFEGDRPRRKITEADLKRINLGKQYWSCTIDGVQYEAARVALSRYAKKIVEMVKSGAGLIVGGERGVGKTGAAAVLVKEAVRRGFTAYFVTFPELRDLQFNDRVYGDGSDGITVNQQMLWADFLVLDGLDDPFLTDKVFGPLQLERLVSRRNNNQLTTVITTRVMKQLSAMPDLFDILRQALCPVVIRGKNLRDDVEGELRARVLGEGREYEN